MPALRNRHFLCLDLLLLPAAAVLAFALRLDAAGMQRYTAAILVFAAVAVPVKLLVCRRLGLYQRLWRYASVEELLLVAVAAGVSAALAAAILFSLALPLAGIRSFPRSIPLIDGLLMVFLFGGTRFGYRLAWQSHRRGQRQRRQQGKNCQEGKKRVLIAGAGDAGTMIVKEMQANPQLGLVPAGFLDDDPAKHGVQIGGVPVLGGREHIPEAVRQRQAVEVIIAMPSAPGTTIRQILAICERAGVPARTVPGLPDILTGQVSVSQLRKVDIEDLLRRDPVQTDISTVERMLRGCRVLVTGAGGSIGGELCRQIARCGPEALILVGHGENSIFAIGNELRRLWPNLPTGKIIADVRDHQRLRRVFDACRPQIIFHAAAHKHVPLMEENVAEAITNNVQGTANLLHLAGACGVGRFVLISSDKAVNPTSVMGSTKRVAELLVQDAAHRYRRPYVAVRFGNVLGSRGSVVPLFREQIARGGPLTVTDPEVRRYFMTIPEAVQLVLQAAALGRGGEVFVLDMGEPVRIVDLARDLVELSGLRVGHDVDLVYTGLRPGEKLFEELFVQGEEYGRTRHEQIFVSRNGEHCPGCPVDLEEALQELLDLARRGDERQIRGKLQEIVPEYRPA